MPMLGDTSSGHCWQAAPDCIDAASATELYRRDVPVRLRLPELEERVADLTVRIMSGAARGRHAASRVRPSCGSAIHG